MLIARHQMEATIRRFAQRAPERAQHGTGSLLTHSLAISAASGAVVSRVENDCISGSGSLGGWAVLRKASIACLGLTLFLQVSFPHGAPAAEQATQTLLKLSPQATARLSTSDLKELTSSWDQQVDLATTTGAQSVAATAATGGFPSEAVIVRGIIQFLAERAQAEALLVYEEQLQSDLKNSKFRCLMPAMEAALENLVAVPGDAGLPAVARAFTADLRGLSRQLQTPACLDQIITGLPENSREPIKMKLHWFRIGVGLYSEIRQSGNPVVVLAHWADPTALPGNDTEVRPWLAALGIVAAECLNHSDLITDLTDDKVKVVTNIVIAKLKTDFQFSQEVVDEVANSSGQVGAALRRLVEIDRRLREFSKTAPSDPAIAAAAMVRLMSDMSALLEGIAGFNVANRPPKHVEAAKAFAIAVDLERAVAQSDWAGCVERFLFGLREMGVTPNEKLIRAVEFGSALAQCKSSDDVAKVLRSVTLPAGSYRAKRRRGGKDELAGTCVQLNAYVALGAATERVARDKPFSRPAGHSVGLYAPIGLEISRGCDWFGLGSVSACVSVLDPGNLVQVYYQKKSDLEAAEDLRFRDILAPGLFLTGGLTRRYPLSVLIGYELAPRLRLDASATSRTDMQRFVFAIGLDLPLVRL